MKASELDFSSSVDPGMTLRGPPDRPNRCSTGGRFEILVSSQVNATFSRQGSVTMRCRESPCEPLRVARTLCNAAPTRRSGHTLGLPSCELCTSAQEVLRREDGEPEGTPLSVAARTTASHLSSEIEARRTCLVPIRAFRRRARPPGERRSIHRRDLRRSAEWWFPANRNPSHRPAGEFPPQPRIGLRPWSRIFRSWRRRWVRSPCLGIPRRPRVASSTGVVPEAGPTRWAVALRGRSLAQSQSMVEARRSGCMN